MGFKAQRPRWFRPQASLPAPPFWRNDSMSESDSTAFVPTKSPSCPTHLKESGATKALQLVAWARKNGRLLHPSRHFCVDCGNPAEVYEHRDYGRPLDVEPVCRDCNRLRGSARPAENDDPDIRFPKSGTGFVLSKQGIVRVAFDAVDFFPMAEGHWKTKARREEAARRAAALSGQLFP
jgi:hypothetical protein